MVRLTLTGEPKSTQHCYKYSCAGGFMRGYMAADCKSLKEDYSWQARGQYHGDPLEGPLAISATIYLGTKRKADIDNFNKLWLDSLSGIVFLDDSQITRLVIEKAYDKEAPRIELELSTA